MAESPAELLERAADLIEEYAADATPGPWFYNGRITFHSGGHMLETEDRSATREQRSAALGDVDKQGDACWIVTLNPVIAAPLVELLRDAAKRAAAHPHLDPDGSTYQRCALDFARRILAQHPKEAA